MHPSVPAKSVAELIAVLKNEPGKFIFASGGFGNPAHLLGEMFLLRTGTRATHVPYPQGQQFTADLLNGATQFSFISSVRVVDLVAAGKLRRLRSWGRSGSRRSRMCRRLSEAGFPDLAVRGLGWLRDEGGDFGSNRYRLNDAMNRALAKAKCP